MSVNRAQLQHYEAILGQPYLWNALTCDRRIMMGPYAKYTQNYRPRYTYSQMLRLLQTGCQAIEAYLTSFRPDAIIGFNMATFGEYLFYLFARRLQIPYWQIKGTKIANYMTVHRDPLHLSDEVRTLQRERKPSISDYEHARNLIEKIRSKTTQYEGNVIAHRPTVAAILPAFKPVPLLRASAATYLFSRQYRHDHQTQGGLGVHWHLNVVRPWRAWRHDRILRSRYISLQALTKIPFALYPLHTEPEIALSIYGRQFQNQIEVIRAIAANLPVGMRLAVKDHPRASGWRTLHYYRKLLEIPGVVLIDPYHSSHEVIEHAQALITVSGWMGFEAVVAQKPVITLGEVSYNALPQTMVTHIERYEHLGQEIARALASYQYDEAALVYFVATVVAHACPINLYTDILQKKGRHRDAAMPAPSAIENFAAYLAREITG